jgi:hypothetical protein
MRGAQWRTVYDIYPISLSQISFESKQLVHGRELHGISGIRKTVSRLSCWILFDKLSIEKSWRMELCG